jgi:hypothetical protein
MSIIPHTNAPIFRNSALDCDLEIVSYLSPRDHVRFSFVNHRTYELLDNDPFFKTVFEKYLAGYHGSCGQYLSTYYPENCWKIGCFYIDPQGEPIYFNGSLLRAPITQFFPAQPAKIKREIEGICGMGFEDPSSPIHRAWVAHLNFCEKSGDKYEKLSAEANILFHFCYAMKYTPGTIERMLEMIGSDENFKEDQMAIENNPGSLEFGTNKTPVAILEIIASDENFKEHLKQMKSLGLDLPELMRTYVTALKKQESGQPLTTEEEQYIEGSKAHQKRHEYDILENKRVSFQKNLDDAESILKILADPSKGEAASKKFEEINRRRLGYVFSSYYLNRCSLQIQSVLEHPIEGSDPRIEKIRTLINSCLPEIIKYVWGESYEDRWSELHFPEHLLALKSILEGAEWQFDQGYRDMNLFPNLENQDNSIPS